MLEYFDIDNDGNCLNDQVSHKSFLIFWFPTENCILPAKRVRTKNQASAKLIRAYLYNFDCILFPGDFVIVDPIEEGNKVCAEIVHILYIKQIKYLKSEGLW